MSARLFVLFTAVMAITAATIFAGYDVARADTPLTPQDALSRLFNSPQVDAAWFAPSFSAQVPVAQVQDLVDRYRAQLGAVKSVRKEGSGYELAFDKGSVSATIILSASGQITGLLFKPPVSNDPVQAKQTAIAAIKKLPGTVGLLITRDGKETDGIVPDQRLAVGSAFKLAILAALQDQIVAGKHRWDEVITLKNEWRSLPTGMLQNWAEGSPLTLQTVAALMISISDNTAADALLDIVGREAVEKYAPANVPFLSTRETFTLKLPRLFSLLERYRAATPAGRRAMLPEINAQPFDTDTVDIAPDTLDIEWFFSMRELCGLLDKVGDSPVFAINPGLADKAQWRSVAFKGGSEPGVLNLSHRLVAPDGTTYCVAITWVDPDAEQEALTGILAPLLQALRKGG
jgi:beta-lactamase class A